MDFDNRLKGYIAEAIIENLLIDAGHVVIRTGIERVLLEPAAKQGAEGRIDVPLQLRKAPDFFVFEKGGKQASRYVEIKYRSGWTDDVRAELGTLLCDQLKLYERVFVIVCRGEAQVTRDTPHSWSCDHIRVIRSVLNDDGLVCHKAGDLTPLNCCPWSKLNLIQEVFPRLEERKDKKTLLKAATLIANIDKSIQVANKWVARSARSSGNNAPA